MHGPITDCLVPNKTLALANVTTTMTDGNTPSDRKKGLGHKREVRDEEFKEKDDHNLFEASITYITLSPADLCPVPMTRNIAICDKLTDTLCIVNRDDWSVERSLGQVNIEATSSGKKGSEQQQLPPTLFSKLTCIASFQIGFRTYYCAAQEESDRAMILSEGGNILHILGESGLLPGQFDTPSAIAVCLTPENATKFSLPPPTPEWYMGQVANSYVTAEIAKKQNNRPGVVRVAQRPKVPNAFDVCFVQAGGVTVSCSIQKHKETKEATLISQFGSRFKPQPSVDHIIRNSSDFKKV